MSPVQAAEQEERRRKVGQLYIGGGPKRRNRQDSGLLQPDRSALRKLWLKELIKDPVEHRARTLGTLVELEREAAETYLATESTYWWDRWLRSVVTVSKFLGLDAPTKLGSKLDTENVYFTIEFETPGAPRVIDASYDGFALEDPPLMEGE